jgi:hypothetical protein
MVVFRMSPWLMAQFGLVHHEIRAAIVKLNASSLDAATKLHVEYNVLPHSYHWVKDWPFRVQLSSWCRPTLCRTFGKQ